MANPSPSSATITFSQERQTSLADPEPVIDLIEAFRRSKTMFTAVRMGIFDVLLERPMNADEVALRLASDRAATGQLLEACVALRLLTFGEGLFRNTELSATYLAEASPRSLAGYILYSDYALYPMWGHLEDAVREGTARWGQTFGSSGPIFDLFFSGEDKLRTFISGMHGLGLTVSPAIATAFDLSRFHLMADLGAATGHLAIAACEAWPELRATVFDLDRVLPLAREKVAKSPARDRISCRAGDFFRDPLPSADLYALGRVLHDWGEEKIGSLLRRLFEALPAGGGLLIAEKLIGEDRSGPVSAYMQSLNMLVCTEGKERSFSEYKLLLEQAGFRHAEARITGLYLDAILARKG